MESKIYLKYILTVFIFISPLYAHAFFDYQKESKKLERKIEEELINKNRLFRIVEGGSFCNQINEIEMVFFSEEHLNIDEGRELYVKTMELILHRFNAAKNLRPYFRNYPFTIENVNLFIMFPDDEISAISRARGKLFYKVLDKNTDLLEKIYEEPYQDALRLVHGEKADSL